MAQIRPFAGVRFSRKRYADVSAVIAPPFDVLDAAGKATLQGRDPHNIVTLDLPYLPPKAVGPDAVYAKADVTLRSWVAAGVLTRDTRPAIYPYTQTFEHAGKTFHRRGFIALVRLSPFGAGEVVPHEQTYAAAIEDRLKLARATGMQFSPIFGLFNDPKGEVTTLLYANALKPEQTGKIDGGPAGLGPAAVQNDLWSVIDAEVENQVIDLMKHRPIYIADGHHRYTMALEHQKWAEQQNGGPLPASHPANYCMFVLVGTQDDGLLILPTHRLIGGLGKFDVREFAAAVEDDFDVAETPWMPDSFDELTRPAAGGPPPQIIGLFDGTTRKMHTLRVKNPDVLKRFVPNRSDAWRKLDVAIVQRYLLDEVIQPLFGGGNEVSKGYTADSGQVAALVDNQKYQIGLLVRPTPLHALEELGKTNEVMPPKSTYFFPKLATGMVLNPWRWEG